MKKLYMAAAAAFFWPALTFAATPLVEMKTHGGMCDGSECSSTVTIEPDGKTLYDNGVKDSVPHTSSLTPEDLELIKNLIAKADFDSIRSTPFTGTCPTASDGAEVIYTLYTAGGVVKLADCTYAIDITLEPFKTLDRLRKETITKAG